MKLIVCIVLPVMLSACATYKTTEQKPVSLSGKGQLMHSYCFQNMYGGIGSPPNYVSASRWCRQAAEQGNKSAQTLLGEIHFYGLAGPLDYAQAVNWYLQAAGPDEQHGHPHAQFMLFHLFKEGLGVASDKDKARDWLSMAQSRGHPAAMQIQLIE